jgi:2'-hydroxyisoflavone reductase
MKLLVIGGTHFVGRAAVEEAVSRGQEVTVFHRGPAEPERFPEVEHVHGDRDGGLAVLAGRAWDVVLDTCGYVPRQIREVAETLGDGIGHYGFVSSISVYPDGTASGASESTTTSDPLPTDSEDVAASYGPLKVACERAALAAFPGRCLIVRPGYIVGPHDPTDRFTCWVRRAAAGGEMLAPEPRSQPLQVIDARDLAAFTLDHLEARTDDVFCVVGPAAPLTWDEALAQLVAVGSADTQLTWVGEPFLMAQLGDDAFQALPLWEIEDAGLHGVNASKAVAAGLRYRPFAETVADTLRWDRDRAEPKAGLGPAREAALLAAWHASEAEA